MTAVLDAGVMVRRCLRRSWRDPEAFFTALMLPVVLMLLFVYVFGGALRTGGRYVDYVVPGLVVLCAAFGAGTTAVAVATDLRNGIVERFLSLPIARSSFLAGHLAASLARNLIATALVIAAGLLVGWHPHGDAGDWLAAAGVIVTLILAMSCLAAMLGLLARSPEAASSVTIGLMFIPYVSSAFVPVATMPGALRAFARVQPFTPVVETMRGLWMGHTSTGASVAHEALVACGWCAALLVICGAAAARLFARRAG